MPLATGRVHRDHEQPVLGPGVCRQPGGDHLSPLGLRHGQCQRPDAPQDVGHVAACVPRRDKVGLHLVEADRRRQLVDLSAGVDLSPRTVSQATARW
jgi:hypothetical protein